MDSSALIIPGSYPDHTIYAFSIIVKFGTIFVIVLGKGTVINKKRPLLAYIIFQKRMFTIKIVGWKSLLLSQIKTQTLVFLGSLLLFFLAFLLF